MQWGLWKILGTPRQFSVRTATHSLPQSRVQSLGRKLRSASHAICGKEKRRCLQQVIKYLVLLNQNAGTHLQRSAHKKTKHAEKKKNRKKRWQNVSSLLLE